MNTVHINSIALSPNKFKLFRGAKNLTAKVIPMLNRTFAGFHGLFIGGNEAVYCRKTHKNQSLDCSKGGAGHDHLSMLFRSFAVYIKLGLADTFAMIDAISTILKQAVDLLREGELQRSKFYKEAVEPLHATYLRLKQNHDQTFGLCISELQKAHPDYLNLRNEVERRTAVESIDWMTIDLIGLRHAPTPRREVANAFRMYLRTVGTCVDAVNGERGILFYGGLLGCLPSHFSQQFLRERSSDGSQEPPTAQEVKENALRKVLTLQRNYSEYCAQVEVHLLVLRRECLV